MGVFWSAANSDSPEYRERRLIEAEGGPKPPGPDYKLGTITWDGSQRCCWLYTVKIAEETKQLLPKRRLSWEKSMTILQKGMESCALGTVQCRQDWRDAAIEVSNGSRIWAKSTSSEFLNDGHLYEGIVIDGPHAGKTVYLDDRLIRF